MASRSVYRALALATAVLLAVAIMHDVVPHEAIHTALAQHGPTVTATATVTPTREPSSTATATATVTASPTGTATVTETATSTQTPTQAPMSTPAATSTPSGGSGTCVDDKDTWHGAVGPGGCTYGHEHGSAPPSWIAAAGYQVRFNGAFNTSPIENASSPTDAMPEMNGKHNAMKGYLGTNPLQGGGQFYIRYHAASNVHDRMSRFHSFEIWFRDDAGGVSHWQGWADSGDPDLIGNGNTGAGGRRFGCSSEIDIRPETIVRNEGCNNELNEHWYMYPRSGWQPTFSVLMEATTYMYVGEYAQTSMVNWRRTGALGTGREISMVVAPGSLDLAGQSAPKGVMFYATQFGEVVSGPSDPKCSAQTAFPAQPTANFFRSDTTETYQNVCLQNLLASTLPGFIEQQGFAPGGEFPNTGVRLPN